jgi:hypothetical protein
MEMQSLKKYVMFVLMAVLVASFAISPAQAQSAGAAASIPFDFSVGKIHLKAGDYRIQPTGALGTFLAFSSDGNTKYTLVLPGDKAGLHNGQPYLVFQRYGSEVFLRKFVLSAEKTYSLPRTSREKEILAGLSSGEQVDIPMGSAR